MLKKIHLFTTTYDIKLIITIIEFVLTKFTDSDEFDKYANTIRANKYSYNRLIRQLQEILDNNK